MVMTILLHDANDLVLHQHGIQLNKLSCNELVYADDTLLLEIDARHLQVYMECVANVGREYGLSLNWSKVEQINVNCQDMHLYDPDDEHITVKAAMKYLGASLSSDGHIEAEVAQRLGCAAQEFKKLKRIWNHCNISTKFKFTIFMACVVQKLLYSLESAWLNKALLHKLDGFFARCLRQILKISHSYISRVSNKYVLQQFRAPALSSILLQRQLLLFGEIARLPNEDVVRQTVFHEDGIDIKLALDKRRGRPRKIWNQEIHALAMQCSQGLDLHDMLMDKPIWAKLVKSFCRAR